MESREEDGRRIIKETATLAGVQLALWAQPAYWDSRLPAPTPDQPAAHVSGGPRWSYEGHCQLLGSSPTAHGGEGGAQAPGLISIYSTS